MKAALVVLACTDLHLGTVRKISRGNVVLQLDLGEDDWQLVDQILFLIVLPEDRRHLLLQVTDYVSMNL